MRREYGLVSRQEYPEAGSCEHRCPDGDKLVRFSGGVNMVQTHTQFTKYATERYPLTSRVAKLVVLALVK